jgi:hypothetical protein
VIAINKLRIFFDCHHVRSISRVHITTRLYARGWLISIENKEKIETLFGVAALC